MAAAIDPDHSVGLLLFEHRWAARLTSVIRESDGRLINWLRIPPAAIDEVQEAIRKDW